jgi:heme exporter protein CcmD
MIETYASFVWSCYGITAAIVLLNIWLARRSFKNELAAARRRQQMKSNES